MYECKNVLTLSLPSSESIFSQLFKEKCICEVVRIGSTCVTIFHLSKLWKAKFSNCVMWYFWWRCIGVRLIIHYPFHSQEWSISNFPCSLTRNIASHSMENLTFHKLTQMKDDYTTNSHCITCTCLFKGWENVLFELGSERVTATVHIAGIQ